MSTNLIRQESQIRKSTTFDGTLAAGSTLETGAVSIEDDLNALRSQLTRLLKADGTPNWYDDVSTVNSKKRGIYDLNFDLDDIEEKPFLFRTQVLTDITVPTAVAATGSIDCDSGGTAVLPADGETFVLNDGVNAAVTFEFDTNSSVTQTTTLRQVDISAASTDDDVRNAIISAVNGAPTLDITASSGGAGVVSLVADAAGTASNQTITETVAAAGFVVSGMSGGAGDVVVLSVSGSEAPTLTAAVSGTQSGAVVAVLGTDVGSWSAAEVAGSSVIAPKNLVRIRNAATDDPIIDVNSGREILGLLQAESGTLDGDSFNDTDKQVQISFVVESSSPHDLVHVNPTTISGLDINYTYARRLDFDSLPEDAFLNGIFADQVASADVTLNNAIDNQVGAATQDQDIDWRVTDTYTLSFSDSAGLGLLKVMPNAAGDEVEVNVDTFDVNNTNDADFSGGALFDTSGTTISVGSTAGQIDSAGALTLASGGTSDLSVDSANDLILDAGLEIKFIDVNKATSTFTGDLKLAETAGEWDAYETAFGEVSILNALVQAKSSSARTRYEAVVNVATIAPDTNVTNPTNLDAALGDYSAVTFVDDVDIYLNGVLLRNGADASANYDVYPGTTPANGDLMFELRLRQDDRITMVIHGS